MDWKIFATALGTIFLAELGDKTQLATLSMSAGSRAKWAVFLGSAIALVATSAIAVLVGDGISRYVSPLWMRRIAGAAFIALGLVFVLTAGRGD